MSNTGKKSRIVLKFRALSFRMTVKADLSNHWQSTTEPSCKSTYLIAWHSKGHSMSHRRSRFMMPHGSLASLILTVSIRLSSTDMSRQIMGWTITDARCRRTNQARPRTPLARYQADESWPARRVQPVAAVKRFLRKGVAVNRLHSFVFVVAQHRTVVESKMTLAPRRGLQFQGVRQCLYLQTNPNNQNNANNETRI